MLSCSGNIGDPEVGSCNEFCTFQRETAFSLTEPNVAFDDRPRFSPLRRINNHTGQATYQLHGGVGGLPSPQYPMAYPAPSAMGMPPTGMVVGPSYQPMREGYDTTSASPGFATDSSERMRSALGAAQTVGLSLLLAAGTVRSAKSNRSKVLGFPYRT